MALFRGISLVPIIWRCKLLGAAGNALHLQAGQVTFAKRRPTFAEMGLPALSFSSWYAPFAPKGRGTTEIEFRAGYDALHAPQVPDIFGL